MPKPQAAFQGLSVGRCLTLSGGFAGSKRFVPETKTFVFHRGSGAGEKADAQARECVLLTHKEPWLCEIATGQAAYTRPLKRVRILHALRALVVLGPENNADKVEALAFDDSGSDDFQSPIKTPKKAKPKSTSASMPVGTEACVVVRVPQRWGCEEPTRSVSVAMDARRRLWLHVDALPWLIGYTREEKASGGVAPVADMEETRDDEGPVEFTGVSETMLGRLARKGLMGGGTMRRGESSVATKCVHMTFAVAKQAVYDELAAWAASVRAGEVSHKPIAVAV